ncbi:iron chelate uptake ABC transporter family permease subunit [Mycoplasmoides pirum]|uniref:iron chelate uptake ABC transporter family permease subunit n=1 Tax=Mycoplasmoides pirum TaxID=2122 RepID=UPI0004813E69|nr:iron chelate uptake ABC transporter family permease subunit [Mycoplasmoides pirum]
MNKSKILNKQSTFIFIFSVISLILVLFLFFFDSSSFALNIPSGLNANKIWLIRSQIVFKIIISASAIGLGNYLIQLFTKNQFSDVSIIGINTFQQLAISLFILFATNFFLNYEQSYIFSFIYTGIAIFSSIIFYFVSLKTNLTSKSILIYGIFLNVIVTAISYFLLTSNAINQDIIKIRFNYYQTKVFGGIKLSNDLSNIYVSIIIFSICLIFSFYLRLKILAQCSLLSKTTTLGFNNKKLSFFLILLVSILASVVFSLIGIIGFIGASVSFVANKMFSYFKYNIIGSMLIAIILLLLSQYIQISISHFASSISLTTIAGFVGCLIFIVFLFWKK